MCPRFVRAQKLTDLFLPNCSLAKTWSLRGPGKLLANRWEKLPGRAEGCSSQSLKTLSKRNCLNGLDRELAEAVGFPPNIPGIVFSDAARRQLNRP